MITVTFADGCLLATASKSLWQYDYGQQLEIVGLDLPEVFQVDFCNSGDGSTITVLGENNIVSIPDQFIATGRNISAFCFVYDETTGGTTRAEMTLSVLQRPERTDEQPDPAQESVIDQLIAELNDGVDAAAESAEDSEAWAVGTRSGEPVSGDDPAYENSAKYWAEQAHTSLPVTSVNGQTGDVELTLDDIPNGSTYVRTTPAQVQQIETNKDDISSIEVLIPNQASAANQLADKGFVNSSIQTSSAHFRGNWANWAAVPTNPDLYPADDDGVHTPTSNDYMVIQDASDYPVPAGETALEGTWRFKYSGVWATNGRNGWQKEYQVNETPLTAAQLAALNSGATAELIAQISTNQNAIEQLQANKQSKITASGILKGDGSGGVSPAVAGTDYIAPSALDPYRTAADQDEIDAAQNERITDVEQTTTETTIGPASVATFEASAANMPLKNLTVNVEPIQDLHGYDSPWPSGVSKNLIPDGTNTSNGYVDGQYLKNDGSLYSDVNWYTSEYFPVTAGETYTWSTNGNPNSPSICFYDSDKNYISSIQSAQELPKTFTAPADAVYCRASQGKVFKTNGQQIELGSTATTPKPYSNICPISGYNNATIYHSQYNIIEQNVVTQASGWAVSTDAGFTEYNGATVYKGGINTLFSQFNYYTQRIPVKVQPGKRYIVSVWWRSVSAHTENGLKVRLWYDDQTYTTSPPMTANQEWTRIAVVSSADKIPAGIGFQYNNTYSIYLAGLMCMEYEQYMALGDDRASFVCPNDRTTYTIQLGDTVYGGTLDVTGGKMVVDRALVDMGTLSWTATTLNRWVTKSIGSSAKYPPTTTTVTTAIASTLKSVSMLQLNYNESMTGIAFYNSLDGIFARNGSTVDAPTGQLVYELATPIEITLTPTQIDTLLGTNNIWSDAEDVTVTYGAYLETLKTYADLLGDSILSAIAPLESTYTASRAYTVGSYLFVGTKFYKVTAAIGSGDTINPGTNATQTTVAAQLMELAGN